MIKTIYDPDADALHVRFADAAVIETQEVSEGVVLDFDAEGRIVAIEVLEHFPAKWEPVRRRKCDQCNESGA